MMRHIRRGFGALSLVVLLAASLSVLGSGAAGASTTSFDRTRTANLALHYGVCRTWACVNVYGNVGGEVGNGYADYGNLSNSDCTNFISNMLAAGGGLTRSPFDRYNTNPNTSDPAAWWSYLDHGSTQQDHRAHNWTLVTKFWQYMSGQYNPSGRFIAYFTKDDPSRNTNDANLSDVVMADWGTSSTPNYDHLMLETGFGYDNTQQGYSGAQSVEPGYYGDLISQHSPGRSDHSWNYGYTHEHNATYRARMKSRDWYVMHWGSHGINGY